MVVDLFICQIFLFIKFPKRLVKRIENNKLSAERDFAARKSFITVNISLEKAKRIAGAVLSYVPRNYTKIQNISTG